MGRGFRVKKLLTKKITISMNLFERVALVSVK